MTCRLDNLSSVFFIIPTGLGSLLENSVSPLHLLTSSPTTHQRISLFLKLFLNAPLEARRSSNKPSVFLSRLPYRLRGFSSTRLLGSLSSTLWFPPSLPIRVGRFFTNALISQFFLSVPPGARRLSVLTIFRFSFSVPTGLRGFSVIDLLVFLRSFPLGFGGFLSIPEARFFLLIERFFSTAYQRTIPSSMRSHHVCMKREKTQE